MLAFISIYRLSFALHCLWAYCFSKAQIVVDHLDFVITRLHYEKVFSLHSLQLFSPCVSFKTHEPLSFLWYCLWLSSPLHVCCFLTSQVRKRFSSSKWTLKYWVILDTVSPHCHSFCSKMRANLLRWLVLVRCGLIEIFRNDKFLKCQPCTSGEWANLPCAWTSARRAAAQELTAQGWKHTGRPCVTLFGLYHSAEIFSKMEKTQNQFLSYGIPGEGEMCWIPITGEIKELVSICVQTRYIAACLAQLISWEPF